MNTALKWIIGILGALVAIPLLVLLVANPVDVEVDHSPDPSPVETPTTVATPTTVHVPETSTLDAWVLPGPGGLVLDEVHILTGEAAHDAAVDAGVIGPDEDLPNDMWVADAGTDDVAMSVAADATIDMISAVTPDTTVSIDLDELVGLIDGSVEDSSVYGVVPGQPVLMSVTVVDGSVVSLRAVYVP